MDAKMTTGDDIFQCRLCGDCCKGFGGTYVTDPDIEKISAFINCDPEKLISRYCDKSGSRYVLTRGKDGCCIFFDQEKQCTIHPVKPYMCRAWPFIQTLIKNPENWNAMAGSCPGMHKNIPFEDIQRIAAEEKEKLDKKTGR